MKKFIIDSVKKAFLFFIINCNETKESASEHKFLKTSLNSLVATRFKRQKTHEPIKSKLRVAEIQISTGAVCKRAKERSIKNKKKITTIKTLNSGFIICKFCNRFFFFLFQN